MSRRLKHGANVVFKSKLFFLLVILAAVYITLTLAVPPDSNSLQRYNISATKAQLISLTFVIPIVAIWFVGFFGYFTLRRYAKKIKKEVDGKNFMLIAEGIKWLAVYLAVSAVMGRFIAYFDTNHEWFTPTGVIIANYVNLGLLLLAFYHTYMGASGLVKLPIKKGVPIKFNPSLVLGAYVVVGAIYTYAALTNPISSEPSGNAVRATHYLPDWLLLITIVLPTLLMIYLGIFSAYYIGLYRRNAVGILYRKALQFLALGLAVVFVSFLGVTFLSVFSTVLNESTLNVILGIIYLLVFAIGLGYALIAVGANRLKKIEDV